MSAAVPLDRPDVEAVQHLPYLSWAGLVVLLMAEVLALTLRFDGGNLSDRQGWVAGLIGHTHLVISLGICAGAVLGLVLFGSAWGDREWRRLATGAGRVRRVWPFLLCHLGAYGALWRLTGSIFEDIAPSSDLLPRATLWLAAGIATLALWMLTALPLDCWKRLVLDRWRLGLFAGVAGIASLVMGQWTSSLWVWFHGSTFWAVRGVLSLFYSDIICIPEEYLLGTGRFGVTIASQCSGYEGIGLIWAFLGVCFWWFRHELRFPQAFLLIPLGTALSWIFNVLRIAALIAVGDRGWEAMAAGGFHSQAGWLALNGIALGLVVLSRRSPLFSRAAGATRDQPSPTTNPTAAYVAPLAAIALTTMMTGAFSGGGPDRLYAARVLAATAILWYYRRQYGALRGFCSWQAVAAGSAVFALWTALEPASTSSEAETAISEALSRMPTALAGAWLAARAIGSVIVVPLAEELAFRGYLTRRLIAADFQAVPEGRFTWPSFLISSLLFGLLHQQRWLAGTAAGMVYALAYYRRGKFIDAIAAHAMTNLLITISVLATGEWSRWS